jgi:2-alkyl-3-oxoalkanoate reductase
MARSQISQPIRVGIVGAGFIARFHAQALKKLPGVTLEAVCDRDQTRAATLQQAFRIPRLFTSIAAMSRGVVLDAVHVLVPPAAHANTAMDCLDKGWHVLVEKPFATTPEECRDIEDAALRAGRFVGVNHNLTFLPSFLGLISDIRSRRLGRIENVFVCWNMPLPPLATGQTGHWMFAELGNIILELGPHPLSAIVRLMGPPESAKTVLSDKRTLRNGSAFFATWQMLFVCERGPAQCYFSVGGNFLDCFVHVVGQDGSATVDLIRNTYVFSTKTRFVSPVDSFVDAMRRSRSLFADGFHNISTCARGVLGLNVSSDVFSVGMRNSIVAFHEAISRGGEPPAGIVEGTTVIRACHAVIDSVRSEARQYV